MDELRVFRERNESESVTTMTQIAYTYMRIAYNIHWFEVMCIVHMVKKNYERDKMFIGRWTRVQKWKIYEKEVNKS